ncbi:peptidoglycan editing factor PgeF [Qipengyuania marisflavi]|uniref:Purine nucleoside phosphorylase n=1 Tax=Qipengyuania marisflavi TaxID=2486356 RepID=A0A5S3P506_9SPHN|nr:peptidoglycan editing factor PgeF [Qipengyuania marisflavi]TMM48120.1 peptidoglycan editing factor PgeF [Qipengyuania marisflavi]
MADFLRSDLLGPAPHGFSLRSGLVAGDVLRGAHLVLAKQVHSPAVMIVHGQWAAPPEADALVTTRRGLLLGIVTADCAPVLLVDAQAGVIGAAHAGWRGAVGGVIDNTVGAMVSQGAQVADIRAVIGPTIAQENYEVDEDFRDAFEDEDTPFFSFGAPGKRLFNLPAYVAHRLAAAGVGHVADLGEDTYAQDARFFSYRRATHRGEPTGGRQLSVIGLPA